MSAANDPPPPYQAQDPVPAAPLSPPQRVQCTSYHVYRTFSSNYNVLLDDKSTSFYINNRIFRAPDLIVHQGDGSHEKAIASVNFPQFGNYYEMNIFREVNIKWSAVQTKMALDGHFTATVPVPNAIGTSISTQRPFAWKKTPTGKELIDGETNQMIAAMHSITLTMKKCFVLETQAPYGIAFEILVLISAMVLYESQNRGFSKPSGSYNSSRKRGYGLRGVHGGHGRPGIAGSMAVMIGGAPAGGGGGC